MFCAFSLGNVLRATTSCPFSTAQLLKVLRSWGVLYILTSTCASRYNCVQFFISYLASWLRTQPTFRPSRATNHGKNTVFRDFHTFSRTCIFFLLRLSLLWSSFFFSSFLWLFPSLLFICPYCGSLTSKLPSIIYIYIYWNFDIVSTSGWLYIRMKPPASQKIVHD